MLCQAGTVVARLKDDSTQKALVVSELSIRFCSIPPKVRRGESGERQKVVPPSEIQSATALCFGEWGRTTPACRRQASAADYQPGDSGRGQSELATLDVARAAAAGKTLAKEAAAVDWLRDAFGHLKAIAFDGGAEPVLRAAGIAKDAGVISASDRKGFIQAAKTRQWDREPKLRTLA